MGGAENQSMVLQFCGLPGVHRGFDRVRILTAWGLWCEKPTHVCRTPAAFASLAWSGWELNSCLGKRWPAFGWMAPLRNDYFGLAYVCIASPIIPDHLSRPQVRDSTFPSSKCSNALRPALCAMSHLALGARYAPVVVPVPEKPTPVEMQPASGELAAGICLMGITDE